MTLPYWIEGTDKVWMKDDLEPFATNVYMVKKTEGYSPNGDQVFEFFDGFDGTSLGSAWTPTGSHTISNSKITVTGTGTYVRVKTTKTFPINTITEFYGCIPNPAVSESEGFGFNMPGKEIKFLAGYPTINILQTYTYNTAASSVNLGTSYTGWNKYKIVRNGITDVKFYINNVLKSTHTSQIPTGDYPLDIVAFKSGQSTYVDYVFVRKYTSAEPTITVSDAGSYYKVSVRNNTNEKLSGYQFAIPGASLGITADSESLEVMSVYIEEGKQVHENIFTDCIAYWDMKGNAQDVMGSYNGTVNSVALTTDRFGIGNYAYDFTGSGKNITISKLMPSTITVCAYIKYTNIGNYQGIAQSYSAETNDYGGWIFYIGTNGTLRCDIAISATSIKSCVGNTVMPLNTWIQVSLTHDGSNIKLYINGVLDGECTAPSSIRTSSTSYNYLGFFKTWSGCSTYATTVKLGDAIVFKRALFGYEIKQIYELMKYRYIYPIKHVRRF